MINYLRDEGIPSHILNDILNFTDKYPVLPEQKGRIPVPSHFYYGKEIWEEALCAILSGKNLLLVGPKATGKNIFAENLATAFGRPRWDISFHINMDASTLIGTDTFQEGHVVFRPGPVSNCAKFGGFGILDEINMAKNEALAVLHAALDFRRVIDVPGYDRICLHPATRFIATMNYGYAGTRELNEALTSRFAVIQMPGITYEYLRRLLCAEFPKIREKCAQQFAALFLELQKKCENSEISSRPLDLRGLLDAVSLMEQGLEAHTALDMGITNKSFDQYERTLIQDIIRARLPKHLRPSAIFERERHEP